MTEADIWKAVRKGLDELGAKAPILNHYKTAPEIRTLIDVWLQGGQDLEDAAEAIVEELLRSQIGISGNGVSVFYHRDRAAADAPKYQMNDKETVRMRAIRDYYCLQMNQYPKVQSIRRDVQRLISPKRMDSLEYLWRFITSPLSILFSADKLIELGVSPLDEGTAIIKEEIVLKPVSCLKRSLINGERPREDGRYTYEQEDRNVPFLTATIRLPNGVEQTIEHNWSERLILSPSSGDICYASALDESEIGVGYFEELSTLGKWSGDFGAGGGKVQGFSRTIVGDILGMCQTLSNNYSISIPQAMLFLLCGMAPKSFLHGTDYKATPVFDWSKNNNIGASIRSIRLDLPLWMSGEQVKNYFMKTQRRHGATARPVPNVALFEFVNACRARALDAGEMPPTWPQLYEKWLKERPTDETASKKKNSSPPKDYRNFRTLYESAENALRPLAVDHRKLRKEFADIAP